MCLWYYKMHSDVEMVSIELYDSDSLSDNSSIESDFSDHNNYYKLNGERYFCCCCSCCCDNYYKMFSRKTLCDKCIYFCSYYVSVICCSHLNYYNNSIEQINENTNLINTSQSKTMN
jgi:hypothetical protein